MADAQTRGSAPQIPHIIGYRRASSSASSITTAAGVSELKILEEARANEEIARNIFGLRTKAGLTTTASVICRLEDADYEGHSLAMLRRIAAALNQRVEIRFVPIRRSA